MCREDFDHCETKNEKKSGITFPLLPHSFEMEYYSAIIKLNNTISINMDGTRDSHPESSKSERERQIPYDIIYNWNLTASRIEHLHRNEYHGLGLYSIGCLMW